MKLFWKLVPSGFRRDFPTAPAGIRLKRRVEAAFKEINERFAESEAAIQNLTDGQHEFLVLTLSGDRRHDERPQSNASHLPGNGAAITP